MALEEVSGSSYASELSATLDSQLCLREGVQNISPIPDICWGGGTYDLEFC